MSVGKIVPSAHPRDAKSARGSPEWNTNEYMFLCPSTSDLTCANASVDPHGAVVKPIKIKNTSASNDCCVSPLDLTIKTTYRENIPPLNASNGLVEQGMRVQWRDENVCGQKYNKM